MHGFRGVCGLASLWVVLHMHAFTYAQDIMVSPTSVQEDAVTATFTITPDVEGPGLWFLSVETVDGTAMDGTDYDSNSEALSSLTATDTFDVNIIDIPNFQGNRTFFLNFTGGNNVNVTYPVLVEITIIEDEDRPVEFATINNMTVYEDEGEINITLNRLDTTDRMFTLMVMAAGGDATEDADFNITTASIDFMDDQNDGVLSLVIIDDDEEESTEIIGLWLNSTDMEEGVVVYVTVLDNDTPRNFHCGRASQMCEMGKCNLTTAECMCDMGFEGADCGINSTHVDASACDPPCVNGTCVSGGECICDPGYAGNACDKSAYFVDCLATSYVVCFTPFGIDNFVGSMFVVGELGNSDCILTPAPDTPVPGDNIPDWCEGYALVIDYNGTCGEFGPLPGVTPTTYEAMIKIVYSPANISKKSDETVHISCTQGEGEIESDAVNLPGSDRTFPQVAADEFGAATFTLTDANQNPIAGLVLAPIVIFGYISVETVPAFDLVTINRIVAHNGRPGDDYRFLVLYDRGCFPVIGGILWGPARVPEGQNHTVCFEFEAFIFIHDLSLPYPLFFIRVEFDVDDEAVYSHQCNETGTPSGEVTYGRRRKRQAGGDERTIEARITFNNPDAQNAEKLHDEESACVRWLYPAFISVGVVAFTMLIIIVILSVAVYKQYNEKKDPHFVYK